MPETTEGIIRFQLDFIPGPAPQTETLTALNAWRSIFRRLGLLGQDPKRYGGFGFGNLSRRVCPPVDSECAFVISGTQTGALPRLDSEHYVKVLRCVPVENRIVARGPIHPSSESLTHGLLYRIDPAIAWVMHLHSPEIFRNGEILRLPATRPDALCGTPEMAEEVARLHQQNPAADPGLILMGGHPDGLLAYGSDVHKTGALVMEILGRARAADAA